MFQQYKISLATFRHGWSCPTLFLLAALAGGALTSWAQPANDNFANAVTLTGAGGAISGMTAGATAEAGEPAHLGTPLSSVWYRWTAPSTGPVNVYIEAADFDTVIAAYTGNDVASLVQLASNDDAFFFNRNIHSLMSFFAEEGMEYWIAVDTFDGMTGSFVLDWALTGNQAGEFSFTTTLLTVTENESVGAPIFGPVNNVGFNPRDVDGVLVSVQRTGGAVGRVSVDYFTRTWLITNMFDTNIVTTNAMGVVMTNSSTVTIITNSANPSFDFFPASGRLTFDHLQTSTNFIVLIGSDGVANGLKSFEVVLTNAMADPLENPDVIAPVLAVDHFSQVDVVEVNHALNLFSIEKATYRESEDGGTLVADIILPPGSEPGGEITIEIVSGNPSYNFPLKAGSDYADVEDEIFPDTIYTDGSPPQTNSADVVLASQRFTFEQGQNRHRFTMTINDDAITEFNEDFIIRLTDPAPVPPFGIGWGQSSVTILDDEQTAGALDREWNPDFILSTDPPVNLNPGANNEVLSVSVTEDQKTVIGGDFTSYNGNPRTRLARINPDGSHDPTFNPGTGANGFVNAVYAYPTNGVAVGLGGKILVGGGFSSINSIQRNGIARLQPDGSLDTSFDPGAGFDGVVRALIPVGNGQVVAVGDFRTFNGTPRHGVARLNDNGSLDVTFNPGSGVSDGIVWAVAAATGPVGPGSIYIAGEFESVNGVPRRGIARLTGLGMVDPTFNPGGGANGSVYAVASQADGRVLLGGFFDEVDFQQRTNVARLNVNGSLDESFNPGHGANDSVYSIVIQPDGKAILGGEFTSFDGVLRQGITRLYVNGVLDTSFMDTAYNHFAGLNNVYSFEPANFVNSMALESDGDVMIGGSFQRLGGHAARELFGSSVEPDDRIYFSRQEWRVRRNVARLLGGRTPGPGNAEFTFPEYSTDEFNELTGIRMHRIDGRLGTVGGQLSYHSRLATGSDFFGGPLSAVWIQGWIVNAPESVGDSRFIIYPIGIFDDDLAEGNEILDMLLSQSFGEIILGGLYIPLGGARARHDVPLTIVDNDFDAGTIAFTESVFTVDEDVLEATLTLIRTNGSVGAVSVNYRTLAGTAADGFDYIGKQGTLSFASGQTNRTINISILNDVEVEFDESLFIVLTNATGGAVLPDGSPTSTTMTTLTIIDNDFAPGRLNFASTNFVVSETESAATVVVTRSGGNQGLVSVQVGAFSGSAQNGSDFVASTNTVSWVHGDTSPKTVTFPIIDEVPALVEGAETFNLVLLNPSLTGLLGLNDTSVVTIEDDDAFGNFAFGQPVYQADENGTNAIITVVRHSGIAETVNVNYTVGVGGANPAADGTEFVSDSGVLTFLPGETAQSIHVTILDDAAMDGDKSVLLQLTGLDNGILDDPFEAELIIVDDESFNIPAGSADTTFRPRPGANNTVFDLDLQLDGKLVVGGDFTAVNNLSQIRVARFLPDGTLDPTFHVGAGPNAAVRSLVVQPDQRILLGGFFTSINGTNRNYLTRILADGSLDSFFNPGAGADGPVFSMALTAENRIVAGGSFATFNGISRPHVVVLNTNGTIHFPFDAGEGPNGDVWAVAVQRDGKILVGGEFDSVDSVPRNGIARLMPDGSLDMAFDPGTGADGAVRAIAVQLDGGILLGGTFTEIDGEPRQQMARLNPDGSLDPSFLAGGMGADGTVFDIGIQVDGRLIVVGDFTTFNGVTRHRITRLNPDGTTDPSINFGSGADAFISSTVIQPDRRIVIGGDFSTYDGFPRLRIARLHGGTIAGPGQVEFASFDYFVQENGTNAVIAVRRLGGTYGTVQVDYQTVDGTAVDGVDYSASSGTLTFPEGETYREFLVPINDNFDISGDRSVRLELVPGSVTGGATLGPQPSATLTIRDNEGLIEFTASNFSVSEGTAGGLGAVHVRRNGGFNTVTTVDFSTMDGTAAAFADYIPTNGVLSFAPGEALKTFHVRIVNDLLIEGNETIVLSLANVSGSNVLGVASSTLLLLDNDFGPGRIQFTTNEFQVAEGNTAVLTVVRTNGSTGVVSVGYRTTDGIANSVNDYVPTEGVLTFTDGETAKTIFVPTRNDSFFEPTEDFVVSLFNPTGGGILGSPVDVFVDILDEDITSLVAAGSALVAESITPPNNAIDPNETVTVEFFLRNMGTVDSFDVVAYLQSGNGITLPSGPQNYGTLVAGGPAVERPFTFRAEGNSGDRVTANLVLTESGVTNSLVMFRFTLAGNASRTFANTNTIAINDVSIADPYPSSISVANLGGSVTNVTVTLHALTHPYPGDIDVLLVGPGGRQATLMSDAGAGLGVNNVTLTFDDLASNVLPEFGQIEALAYPPANYAGFGTADSFPFPAAPFPYTNTSLKVFEGNEANGVWSLYVVDDDIGQAGMIANGWSLTFLTSDPVMQAADMGLTAMAMPSAVALGNELMVAINVTNYGPATASSVIVQNELPAGVSFMSATATAGSWAKNGDSVSFNVGSLPSGGGASMTIHGQTTQSGALTNALAVQSQQLDMIQENNQLMVVTMVHSQGSLQVVEEDGFLIITWPLEGQYALQSTADLTAPNWTHVPMNPTIVGGQYRVVLPIGSGNRFYRLRAL